MELLKYLHYHLLAAEEGVANEFAGAERYWLLFVCHDCDGLRLISDIQLGRRW